jgi:hypothetical protein
MLKKYLDYIKDNPQGYWFKRKLFGWGWMPVTWQGWLVIVGLLIVIFLSAKYLLEAGKTAEYFLAVGTAVAVVIVLGYWKGEKPHEFGNQF